MKRQRGVPRTAKRFLPSQRLLFDDLEPPLLEFQGGRKKRRRQRETRTTRRAFDDSK